MAGNNKGDDEFDATFNFSDMPQPGDTPPPPSAAASSAAFGGDDFGGDDFGGSDHADLPLPGPTDWDDVGDDVGAVDAPARAPVTQRAEDVDFGGGFGGDAPEVDFGNDATDSGGDQFVIPDDERVVDGDDDTSIEPTDSGRSLASRLALPLMAGAFVLGVGGFCYAFVLPILGVNLFPAQNAPSFTSTPIDQVVALGPVTTDLPLAQPMPTMPSLPQGAPSIPPGAPEMTLTAPSLPVAQVPAFPPVSAAVTVSSEEVDGLRETVAELRGLIEAQGLRLADLESRPQTPAVPEPVATPPEKPPVVVAWSLKGVTNGVGWIDGPEGFLEVREGTVIPNVGKVTAVTRYENQWLVVTDAGIIVE